jgi:phage tail-like protein
MATSTETIRTSYPLPSYNYRVEIGSETIAFAEVSGLDILYNVICYMESPTTAQPGPNCVYFPGWSEPVTLCMKKGVVKSVSVKALYAWIASIQTNLIEKKDIFIRLCDEKGDPVVSWKAVNAFPYKLTGPTFTASSNETAIETMELRADAVLIEET